jgi:hypothetical protein
LEILTTIFEMLQPQVSNFRPVSGEFRSNDLRSILSVCRHWRRTALAFPSLWTNIILNGGSGQHALDCLQRSKGLPLTVCYDHLGTPGWGGDEDEDDTLETLADHTHRFSAFHITSSVSAGDSLWNSLCNPAPLLEALSISAKTGENFNHPRHLPALFSDDTPRLRKLSLSYFSKWPENSFRNLTHLSLHDQAEWSRYSFTDFLNFLESSPGLLELALIGAGPKTNSVSTRAPITLDRLRSLEIGEWSSVHDISHFLAHIIIPYSTNLSVWGESIFAPADHIFSLFPPNSPQWCNIRGVTTVRIAVSMTPSPAVARFISVKDSNLDIFGTFSPHQLFPVSQWFPEKAEEVWLFFSYGSSCPTAEDYQELLSHATSLTTLAIGGLDPRLVLGALVTLDNLKKGSGSAESSSLRRDLRFQYEARRDAVAQLRKYVPHVRMLYAAETANIFDSLWPTAASDWPK